MNTFADDDFGSAVHDVYREMLQRRSWRERLADALLSLRFLIALIRYRRRR
jgi:hypothetical protein